jgi:hypothetical protein
LLGRRTLGDEIQQFMHVEQIDAALARKGDRVRREGRRGGELAALHVAVRRHAPQFANLVHTDPLALPMLALHQTDRIAGLVTRIEPHVHAAVRAV